MNDKRYCQLTNGCDEENLCCAFCADENCKDRCTAYKSDCKYLDTLENIHKPKNKLVVTNKQGKTPKKREGENV